ncbi:SIS domain-containing protein [Mycobacterium sp. WMMD1722]|uniref:SIS domain-containing protein n=1 Tax=Mycobacterium sp. WMMD1722 TaxID=3404117 RepID=UPI003BF55C33
MAEHRSAVDRAAEILEEAGTAHVVGSGGSLPAAIFISDLLNSRGRMAVALTPGEYLAGAARSDTVIAVSYSGASPDIRHVIRAAKQRGGERIVLLTSADKAPVSDELRPLSEDFVLSYGPANRVKGGRIGGRERGFVSIAGTVAPCIPWLVAASGVSAAVDLAARVREGEMHAVQVAKSLAAPAALSGRLNVVYGPGALASARDVESKFTESGLPAVTLHEQKDLSHGRFVTVFQPPAYKSVESCPTEAPLSPVLLLAVGPPSEYQSALLGAIQTEGVLAAEIRSGAADLVAPLELLTLVQFFSQAFGDALDVDISRPRRIPEAGLRLYRWRELDR